MGAVWNFEKKDVKEEIKKYVTCRVCTFHIEVNPRICYEPICCEKCGSKIQLVEG